MRRLRATPIARILQIAGLLTAAAAVAGVVGAGFAAKAAITPPVGVDEEPVDGFASLFTPQDGGVVVFLDAVGDGGALVGLVTLVLLGLAVVLGGVPTRFDTVAPLIALGVVLLAAADDVWSLIAGSGRLTIMITDMLVGLAVMLTGLVLAAIALRLVRNA